MATSIAYIYTRSRRELHQRILATGEWLLHLISCLMRFEHVLTTLVHRDPLIARRQLGGQLLLLSPTHTIHLPDGNARRTNLGWVKISVSYAARHPTFESNDRNHRAFQNSKHCFTVIPSGFVANVANIYSAQTTLFIWNLSKHIKSILYRRQCFRQKHRSGKGTDSQWRSFWSQSIKKSSTKTKDLSWQSQR